MSAFFTVVIVFLFSANLAFASTDVVKTSQLRPVSTYSIIARDPATGEMGVAVQSHWFSIGSLVPWAQAGVGVVATQSFIDVRYGVSGLKLMRDGLNAEKALKALISVDPHEDVRQVAMLDINGKVAAHTGDRCIEFADHKTGKNYSIQANIMMEKGVVDAMEKAYLTTTGTLTERLLRALEAAQDKGGDARGRQSAAILVVKEKPSGRPWDDIVVDLHVEDHTWPLKELRRLHRIQMAYEHMNKGDRAMESNDVAAASREYGKAQALFPENVEMKFWHAVALANASRVDESLPLFREVFSKSRNWRILVRRLYNADIFRQDEATLNRILSLSAD